MIWMTDNREYDREFHQPLYLQVLHPWIQPTLDQKYLKKIPESSPNQNLNWPYTGNYLHSSRFVLGVISGDDLKYMGALHEDGTEGEGGSPCPS